MSFDERERSKQVARDMRKQEDVMKGLSKAKGAQRGDFELCRRLDKTLMDYRRFKDPKDREKINNEYYGLEAEYRKNAQAKMRRNGEN
jgi:hypothetical protein